MILKVTSIEQMSLKMETEVGIYICSKVVQNLAMLSISNVVD
jgi:hypothetical protein